MLRSLKQYNQPIIWLSALVVLYFMDPQADFSFCLLKNLGVTICPGCGIGHAIHFALHLNFQQSFQEHFLGIPAVAIICTQILKSTYNIKQATQ